MTPVRFAVAGVAMTVEGPPPVLELAAALYSSFPKPADEPNVVLRWDGERCHDGAGFVRVSRPDHRAALTPILVLRALKRMRPELILMHGNGLARSDGRLVLLLGESGCGKTTLSRLLADAGMAPVAEDILIMDPMARKLEPFPRAASIRGGTSELPAWPGPGAEREGKRLAPAPCGTGRAVDIAKAWIALLDKRPADVERQATPSREEWIWISHVTRELVRDVGESGLAVEVSEGHGFPALVVPERPGPDAYRALRKVLREHEALILRAGSRGGGDSSGRVFGEAPAAARLPGSKALPTLLPHVITFGDEEPAPGRLIVQLARLLSDATVWEFHPGGSPQESARALERLVEDREGAL